MAEKLQSSILHDEKIMVLHRVRMMIPKMDKISTQNTITNYDMLGD